MSTTTSGAGGGGGAGFAMVPKNDELRKIEEASMHGADLTVNLNLPDGRTETLQVKSANEVGYVKLLLAEKLNIPAKQSGKLKLFLEGKPLLDPMSLCDYPGVSPPSATVEVQIVEQ